MNYEKKVEILKKAKGTWKRHFKDSDIEKIIIDENYIKMDSKTYSISINEDVFFASELPENKFVQSANRVYNNGEVLITIKIANQYLVFVFSSNYTVLDIGGESFKFSMYDRSSSSTEDTNSSGEGDSSAIKESLLGTWNFNGTGNQLSGKFTFNNDGTYTYSGSKSGMPNGKYTVSGNVLTMKYTKNVDVSEEFDVTITGNTMKLTSHNGSVSTVLSAYFGITGLEATFTK